MKHKRVPWVKWFVFFCLPCFFMVQINAETVIDGVNMEEKSLISPLIVFDNIGWNMLHSVTNNYGLNFIGAGLGTWGFIETGLDWKWRNVAYNNEWLANMGLPVLVSGYLIPVLAPVSIYLTGRFTSDTKLQIAGAAVAQSLILSQITHISLKMITGRSVPGIISGVFFEPNHTRDTRTKDFSGEFKWFTLDFYDGWPSGHVASAFSAAAVLAEIYDDNPLLKIGVYTYAVIIALGVSVNAHWLSESFAGALMGYAIGKTVGKNFNRLLGKDENQNNISPLISGDTIGVWIRY